MSRTEVLEFAKLEGWDDVERSDDWRGFEVWLGTADAVRYVGLPLVILVSGGSIRRASVDETFDWLDDQP